MTGPVFIPAKDDRHLDRYEVADGDIVIGLANEHGDVTAYVRRPDGTEGHSYGGPVYDPPEFANVCERPSSLVGWNDWACDHSSDMTTAEMRTADALARIVGWMP